MFCIKFTILDIPQQPTCLQQQQKHGSSSKLKEDRSCNNKQIQTLKIEIDINKSMLKLLIVDILHKIHDFGHTATTNMPATTTKYGSSSKLNEDRSCNNKKIQTLKIETDINKSMLKLLIVDVLHKIHDLGHASTTNLPTTKTKIRIFI